MKCIKIPKNQKCTVEFGIEANAEEQIAICICISETDMNKLAEGERLLPVLKAGKKEKWLYTLPLAVRDLLEKVSEMQFNARVQNAKHRTKNI